MGSYKNFASEELQFDMKELCRGFVSVVCRVSFSARGCGGHDERVQKTLTAFSMHTFDGTAEAHVLSKGGGIEPEI